MKRWTAPALAALPSLLVVVAAVAGWSTSLRDIPVYFVPLRERTAEALGGARGPFWNPDSGCGEPYFANPQTALLYPPAWLALLLPAPQAIGVEVGLHLALLGAGCALLARRLGANDWWQVAAGWGAALAGPMADTAGALNNLDTLAWLPWLWWAALSQGTAGTAVFAGLAFLGAEPQLAAVGMGVALLLAPRRRTVAGLLLAAGLVAVQALPFAAWVRTGDRGAQMGTEDAVAGAIWPAELPALVVPGMPLPSRPDRYVAHPAVPVWVVLCGLLALVRGWGTARRLAAAGVALAALAVLPGLDWAHEGWALLTGHLVRYPSRLLFPALAALAPAAAASTGRARVGPWLGGAVAAAIGLGGLLLHGSPVETVAGGLAAGAALAGPWPAAAALTGALLLAPRDLAGLDLERNFHLPVAWCLDAQRSAGRVYAVQPSWNQFVWLQREHLPRATALGWGYSALLDGRRMVRTFAPLSSRALGRHLREADRGPAGRWWLDTLAAERIVSHHPISGFRELCRAGDFMVYENPQAWPEVFVAKTLPEPDGPLLRAGLVVAEKRGDDRRVWRVRVGEGRGVLVWLTTPDPGWSYTVDGAPVTAQQGAGIVHGVTVPPGEHEVVARYRPPGLVFGGIISLLSVVVLAGVAWRRW